MSGDVLSQSTMTGTPPFSPSGAVVSSTGVPTPGSGVIYNKVSNNFDNFLELVNKIGNACVNNEVCVLFLTATFVVLGVNLLRKVVRAFGRGR